MEYSPSMQCIKYHGAVAAVPLSSRTEAKVEVKGDEVDYEEENVSDEHARCKIAR